MAQPARGGWHPGEWAAELVGTLILVFGGLSAVVLDFHPGTPVARALPSQSARLLLTGVLFAGTGSLVAVSPLGRRSGAHLNPCVTLAFWCTRHVHRHDLIGYVSAQFIGAIAGAELLRAVWGSRAASLGYGVTMPGAQTTVRAAIGIEALMTAVLITTIYAFVSSPRTARWTPLAVWAVVSVLVWRGATHTGTSLNPARSLGPAIAAMDGGNLWVYFVGPLLGTGAAALVQVLFLRRRLVTAKLFHDSRYPSVLRTSLPAGVVRPGAGHA